jgi:acyl carrier protein
MAFREFKASLLNEDEKSATIIRMAKNALLFGNDTLGADSLATLWTIIAIKTNYILKVDENVSFTQKIFLEARFGAIHNDK